MSSKIETRLHIAGEWVSSSKTFPLVDPKTLQEIAQVHEAEDDHCEAAIQAAKKAFPSWSTVSASERATCMRKLAALLREEKNAKHITELELLTGKAQNMAVWPAYQAAGALEYYAGLAESTVGDSSFNTANTLSLNLRQPYGVCAGILPFNVPLIMMIHKAGGALAAGNTMVLKSSEKAPLIPLFVTQLAKEAGFPTGTLSCLSGGGKPGAYLAHHMDIRRISFTGSAPTGRKILEASAKSNLKVVTLELGGKSPAILFEDADLSRAVPLLAASVHRNAGQVCMASTRIYAHASIHDKFLADFKQAFTSTKQEDVGAVIDQIQADRVSSYLETGKNEGKVEVGGNKGQQGLFFEPTIFSGVDDKAKINVEEIFGPVAIVHKFSDEADVVRRANDTEYGLYASVFTQDVTRAIRVGRALESGSIGINTTSPFNTIDMPFGGYKQSGLHRENGAHALHPWLEEKAMYIAL